ncbi:hypothetical protein AAFC00_007091 [Neodothiora populina]|uniref:alpha-amylase n=1 Tax=Neodothiora populina TaxID=2781224 RepID=A0ABR3PC80_9PEZI
MVSSVSRYLSQALSAAAALSYLVTPAQCLSSAQWRSQSIYQVVTDRFARTDGSTTADCDIAHYCGGSWRGIINKLDYIQNMGFTAIWISPVVKNVDVSKSNPDGQAYHGYWAQDIYQINTNFGPASDLVALSSALHARGMYLMVDVTPNHMGYNGARNSVDYSTINPFNQQTYFHSACSIDYSSQTSIETCWAGDNTVALPDLRTEDTNVVTMFQTWIKQLVSNYTIDGLRIDSAAHIDQAFFPPFGEAAGVYTMGEVFNGNEWQYCEYQDYMDGMLNYPAYFWITQAFKAPGGSISSLVNGIEIMIGQCSDTTLLGSFIENHDQPRFPSYTSDTALTKNAVAFSMLADGIPIIYQGQEQSFSGASVPANREALWTSGYSKTSSMYTYITRLNQIRKRAIGQDTGYLPYNAYPVYSDDSTIVMRKGATNGQVVGVFTNKGSSGSGSFTLSSKASGFTAGQSVTDLLTCKSQTTNSNGDLAVTIVGGLPQVFYPSAQLFGSPICGSSAMSASSASATSSGNGRVKSTLSTSATASASSSGSSACATPTSVTVTFEEAINSTSGFASGSIKIVGSVSQLGSWDPKSAIDLKEDNSDECDDYFWGTVSLPPGKVIQYKYISIGKDGYVSWEADPNHTYSVPSGCSATAAPTVSDTWQTK